MDTKVMKKWQVHTFILCWIAYACIYFGRVNLTIAIPSIQNSFNFTKAQVGFIGSVFFWVYGIGQMINGYVGDKTSSRLCIFIGLIVTALMNIFFGFSTSIYFMILFWATNGYFQSMLWGPISKILSYWFSYEERSKVAIGISTSMVGGYLLAWGLSSQIIKVMDWKWTFWIPGISIMLFSFLWYFKAKNHPSEIGFESPNKYVAKCDNNENTYESSMTLWQVICDTKLWFVVAGCFAQGIVKEGIGLWGPTFLMEKYNLNMSVIGGFLMIIPFMNFIGIIFAGWLNKKFNYKEKLTTICLFTAGMITLIALIKFRSNYLIVGLILLGLTSSMMYGANTILLGIIPMGFSKYGRVSTIAGFLDFCSYLAAGCASAITGNIVDKFGWNSVLILWLAVSLIGVAALIISCRCDKKESLELSPEHSN